MVLRRIFGRAGERPKSLLPALLRDYPPYRIPHPGEGWKITREQARANLAYLLAHRAERLQAVGQLLSNFGLDTRQALQATDPKPFLGALIDWTAAEWPSIYDPGLSDLTRWLTSGRDGAEIVFSLVQDVAILLGEMIIVRRPNFDWTLDIDEDNRVVTGDEGLLTWQRPVLASPKGSPVPTITFDLEAIARGAYRGCGRPGYVFNREMEDVVLQALSDA